MCNPSFIIAAYTVLIPCLAAYIYALASLLFGTVIRGFPTSLNTLMEMFLLSCVYTVPAAPTSTH